MWVPDQNLLDVGYSGEERADQTLKSLEDFVPEQWGLPPYPLSDDTFWPSAGLIVTPLITAIGFISELFGICPPAGFQFNTQNDGYCSNVHPQMRDFGYN